MDELGHKLELVVLKSCRQNYCSKVTASKKFKFTLVDLHYARNISSTFFTMTWTAKKRWSSQWPWKCTHTHVWKGFTFCKNMFEVFVLFHNESGRVGKKNLPSFEELSSESWTTDFEPITLFFLHKWYLHAWQTLPLCFHHHTSHGIISSWKTSQTSMKAFVKLVHLLRKYLLVLCTSCLIYE